MYNVAFQPELRPALPVIRGPKEYHEFEDMIVEMDRILSESGLEDKFVRRHLEACAEDKSARAVASRAKVARKALRHAILLAVTGLSSRKLSMHIAGNSLFTWFTGSANVEGAYIASKSAIDRFEKMFAAEDVAQLIHDLNRLAMDEGASPELLPAGKPLDVREVFADTTCIEADIHFPVDWVLLRDAVRTLTKAVSLIRGRGLVSRMSSPKSFMREMNKLCIEMTHARRTKDAKKARKAVLRKMKKLVKVVSGHARRHYDLLAGKWEKTDLSEAQARQVLARIDSVLSLLPAAIRQAHERIIGGRLARNEDKILSLYEPDVHVIVRGKAGAEVEFGNGLYLAEQTEGLIVDWEFFRGQPPADSSMVRGSLARIEANYGMPEAYTADRGFHSKANARHLESEGIFNGICPRSVHELQSRLEEPRFSELQTRRGSTEGRISILTRCYVGSPLRSKGFKNRSVRIEWCIFAHNLCKLAEKAASRQREARKAQAA